MFDSKKTQETACPKWFSQLQQTYTVRGEEGFRELASDKRGNREILRRLSASFTAPKLTIGYAASQRFCFAPVIEQFERFWG